MTWEQVIVFVPVVGVVVSIIGSVIVWRLNEGSKRRHEDYKRREERYSRLLSNLSGFYKGMESKELKQQFLNELNLCWLYCSDDVVTEAYAFIETVKGGQKEPDSEKSRLAFGQFLLTIRKDLLERKVVTDTKLTADVFQVLSPSSKNDK